MWTAGISSYRLESIYNIIQTTASQNHAFCTGALAYSYSRFGRGTGGIFLDNMNCRGTESRLIDCRHSGIGVHNCDHTGDAGVRCSAGESKLMLQAVVIIMNVYFSHKQLLLWRYSSGGRIQLTGRKGGSVLQ